MTRLGLILAAALLAGCATQQTTTQDQQLAAAQSAYNGGDYHGAYRRATHVYSIARGSTRDEAAYLAGISAQRLGNGPAAQSHLQAAARAADRRLAAEANASLGLLHSEQGRFDLAARDLTRAAADLEGQDKANAHFYAAVAQQKLGQWPQARTNLVLARAATQDPAFRHQVEAQLAVTGYTIQVGAFRSEANARTAADRAAPAATSQRVGLPRLVASTDSRGLPVTLVHVGRYATFAAANQARHQLGDQQAIIVPLSR